MNIHIRKGDIVKINEGKHSYVGFVVHPTSKYKGMVVRVLEGKSPRSSLPTLGLKNNARWQYFDDIKSIKTLAHSKVYEVTTRKNTKVRTEGKRMASMEHVTSCKCWSAINPINNQRITFCEQGKGYGGWSDENVLEKAINESFKASRHTERVALTEDLSESESADDGLADSDDLIPKTQFKEYPTDGVYAPIQYANSEQYQQDLEDVAKSLAAYYARRFRKPNESYSDTYSKFLSDFALAIWDINKKAKMKNGRDLSIPTLINQSRKKVFSMNLKPNPEWNKHTEIWNQEHGVRKYIYRDEPTVSLDDMTYTADDEEPDESRNKFLADPTDPFEVINDMDSVDAQALADKLLKYFKDPREQAYIKWMLTKDNIVDYGIRPEKYGLTTDANDNPDYEYSKKSKKRPGWDDEFLARVLGWKHKGNPLYAFKRDMEKKILDFLGYNSKSFLKNK